MNIVICETENDTVELARELAAAALPGQIYSLEGVLGAGKSVFARAFIRALARAPDLNVPSPTFTLVQTYETETAPVWHYDLYRMKDPEEIYELSWDDALSGGIVLIEWAERLGHLKPSAITIEIEPDTDSEIRKITIHEAT